MTFPAWTFVLAVVLAAAVDVAANLMLAKSEGFSRKGYGVGALTLVALAFSFLAYAVQGMDLSIAYAMWGSFGILGTSLGGWVFFRQKMRPAAWVGVAMLACGVLLMHA